MKSVYKVVVGFFIVVAFCSQVYANPCDPLPGETKESNKKDQNFWLRPQEVKEDLEQLLDTLENEYSYWELKKKLFFPVYREILEKSQNGLCRDVFGYELVRLVSAMKDGHTSVVNHAEFMSDTYLPFHSVIYADSNGKQRVVVFEKKNESDFAFLVENKPYLYELDGVSPQRWLDALDKVYGVQRSNLSATLRFFYMYPARKELGLPMSEKISLVVGDDKGRTVKLDRVVSNKKMLDHIYLDGWDSLNSRVISDHNIGYLKIPTMDVADMDIFEQDYQKWQELMLEDQSSKDVREWMQKFKDTDGLIIDIRGNLGGMRHLVQTTMPFFFFLEHGAAPYQISSYVKEPDPSHPALRFMERFNDSQLEAIKKKRKVTLDNGFVFKPKWPKKYFGRLNHWYYAKIVPGDHKSYYYNKPVVLLTDEMVASSSDAFSQGFLSATSERCDVAIIGNPTAGSSGGPASLNLKHSEIK
ncbi:MAG: hypothetical protein KDK51_09195, partial [Deltaproteobacteria bacterium]|nr:hypothetical protein [Deltaproteobacteria bacterium]